MVLTVVTLGLGASLMFNVVLAFVVYRQAARIRVLEDLVIVRVSDEHAAKVSGS